MIIVTGGAGFIGSNIVRGLNARGIDDILVVDDLSDGRKFRNIADANIADFLDVEAFREKIRAGQSFGKLKAIFHQGACSDTTEWDGRFMMDNNYECSKELLWYCNENKAQYIYASSAATYGAGTNFDESQDTNRPINVYGYSKWLFDQYVRRHRDQIEIQVTGLRYFNVYGPNENHKGSMASVAWHFNNQVRDEGEARLFEGTDGYADGAQLRDFIHVDDAVKVNLWFLDNPEKSGIFNVGTGKSQTFNDVANAVISWHNKGDIRYIPFPDHLKGSYQSFTEARLGLLREAGYEPEFMNVEDGVASYLDKLNVGNREK